MSNSGNIKEELGPIRLRSSSANEASKPISVLARRQTHTGTKSHGLSPSSGTFIFHIQRVTFLIFFFLPSLEYSRLFSKIKEFELNENRDSFSIS